MGRKLKFTKQRKKCAFFLVGVTSKKAQRHDGEWHVQEIAADLLQLRQKHQECGKELEINLEKYIGVKLWRD